MKPTLRSLQVFLRQIAGDGMLVTVCIAPLLTACLFRFGIPAAEALLCARLGRAAVLAGYYRLFDLLLASVTPYLFCFASAMVLLEERDDGLSAYLAVTPIGRRGYFGSRLLIPAVWSFLISFVLTACFSLTRWSFASLSATCLLTSALSLEAALLVVALSRNRVEGLAVAKLSGLFLAGLFVPFFLHSGTQYLFSPLPSFWAARFAIEGDPPDLLPAFLTLALWMLPLSAAYRRRAV